MGQPPAPQQPQQPVPPPPAPPPAAPPVAPTYPAQAAGGGNGIAVAAMVCGIVGIVLAFMPNLVVSLLGLASAIVSLVLGAQGLKIAKTRGGEGRGMAMAGLVLGIISCSLAALGLLIFIIGAVACAAAVHQLQGCCF